jgi:hypothetical protein
MKNPWFHDCLEDFPLGMQPYWLVVLTILKNITVVDGKDYPIYYGK